MCDGCLLILNAFLHKLIYYRTTILLLSFEKVIEDKRIADMDVSK